MQIVIRPRDDLLTRYSNMLGALGETRAHQGLARAVNRTTDSAYTRVIRTLVQQTSAPRSIVKTQVRKRQVKPGSGGVLEGVITATGRELPLRLFKPKQGKKGTSATVWGKRQLFPGAFMGPRPGAVAVSLRGHVYHRLGPKRHPIEKLYGPSIPKEMVKDATARAFEEVVADVLPKRVEHEISRLLKV